MTYMVMECHPAYAVLVDEEGRFVKAANRQYEVGQRVTDPILMEKPREKVTVTMKTVGRAVLALAACLLIVLGIARFAATPSPYMSVTMTINPTVRIDLDRDGEVIDVVGLNADGKALLKSYHSDKSDSIEAVTGTLIERAISMGFLHDNGKVSFTVRCDDEQRKASCEQKLSEHTTAIIGERMEVTVEVDSTATRDTTTSTAKATRPILPDDDDDNDDNDEDDDEDDDDDDDDDGNDGSWD